jgi:hypothetical protein
MGTVVTVVTMMVDYDVEGVPIKNYDQQLRKKQVSGQNFQKVHLLYIAVSMMEDYDVKVYQSKIMTSN